jgi:hypothetical protein
MSHDMNDLRTRIAWIADALIPADPKSAMPSATAAGVLDRHLPRALKERDDLAPAFFAAVSRLPEQPPQDPLAAIKALGADDFQRISFLIAGAYFLDEDVNRMLRYPGQEAVFENPDYDEIMDIVERVTMRGKVYVEAPE